MLLPPPSAIAVTFANSLPTLWEDFVQTFVKGALSGYIIGCGAAVPTGIAVDRSPFLQRGLLPVGNFVAALPIIGLAPIMVMWFGFDWQSLPPLSLPTPYRAPAARPRWKSESPCP